MLGARFARNSRRSFASLTLCSLLASLARLACLRRSPSLPAARFARLLAASARLFSRCSLCRSSPLLLAAALAASLAASHVGSLRSPPHLLLSLRSSPAARSARRVACRSLRSPLAAPPAARFARGLTYGFCSPAPAFTERRVILHGGQVRVSVRVPGSSSGNRKKLT
jgi:hypothetical protein